jgi:DNA-binding CsgD family transcriptional regulator
VARGEVRVRARGRSGRWYLLRASLAEPRGGERDDRAVAVIVRPATSREVATIRMRLHALSAREHEIIAAVARGESTKEIAAALGRSPHTVYEHIDRACQKLGVRGRKALVATLFVGATPASSGPADRLAPRTHVADPHGGAAAASVAVR